MVTQQNFDVNEEMKHKAKRNAMIIQAFATSESPLPCPTNTSIIKQELSAARNVIN